MDEVVRRFPLVGAGFLLAVLWFDLMFDVQVLGEPAGPLREEILASIAGYYRRVTTDAAPMGNLVGGTMILTLLAMARQLQRSLIPRGFAIASLVLAAAPIGLAMARVVPNAVRLGGRADGIDVQSELARSIAYEHIGCLVAILGVAAIQLVAARTPEMKTGGEV